MKNISDIVPPMALRPRLVVELNSPELLHQLKVVAVSGRTTVREAVLKALAFTYPELDAEIKKEL